MALTVLETNIQLSQFGGTVYVLIFTVPLMLDECSHFLESRCSSSNFKYEIIVVSDGSKDGTANVVNDYSKKFSVEKIRLLDLEKNRGKGGAVRLVCICMSNLF